MNKITKKTVLNDITENFNIELNGFEDSLEKINQKYSFEKGSDNTSLLSTAFNNLEKNIKILLNNTSNCC